MHQTVQRLNPLFRFSVLCLYPLFKGLKCFARFKKPGRTFNALIQSSAPAGGQKDQSGIEQSRIFPGTLLFVGEQGGKSSGFGLNVLFRGQFIGIFNRQPQFLRVNGELFNAVVFCNTGAMGDAAYRGLVHAFI